MNTGKLIAGIAVGTALPLMARVPTVSNVHMTQPSGTREVTITYSLDAAAVVTLVVQTNATANAAADDPGWTSIGGEAVWNAYGDVWKKVNAEGSASFSGTIKWRPDLSWPDYKILGNGARAKLTAWAPDNTPDYMVVDLTLEKTQDGFVTYYPDADYLPKSNYEQKGAAVTNNHDYKTSKLLMRKVMAAGVKWTMGSTTQESSFNRNATREPTHKVTLTNNYYIGVFEVTQEQWRRITGYNPSYFSVDNAMRPVERVSYTDIRQGVGTVSTAASATGGVYPDKPDDNSFLGILQAVTGIDFDLPSEAQWEFAARAGNGDTKWGDGSTITANYTDTQLNNLARYQYNDGYVSGAFPAASCGPTNGTAIVGTYAPNSWGLYDMHGNVWEWCLDWYQDNIATTLDASGNLYDGRVNVDLSNGSKKLDGTAGSERTKRGGAFNALAGNCRSAYRNKGIDSGRESYWGFRLVCTAGLQ